MMSTARARRLEQALILRGHRKRYALALEMGVSPSSLTRWLQGEEITLHHAVRLCELLDLSLDWLLLGRGGPDPQHFGDLSWSQIKVLENVRHMPPELVEALIPLLEGIVRSKA